MYIEGGGDIKMLKTVTKNVLQLTKLYPETIENYNILIANYWSIFDKVRTVDDIKNATPAESITRSFRMLVSKGLIQVPEEVKEVRKEQEKIYKTEFSVMI